MKNSSMEYRKTARTSPLFYILIVMGSIFVIGGITLDPVKSCMEYPCPLWLRGLAIGLGLLFAVGGLSAVIRDFQYGSRLDVKKRALTWWEGVPPIKENIILMDSVSTILVDSDSDSATIHLLDSQGRHIHISNQCIPYPYATWASHIRELFPHITMQEK